MSSIELRGTPVPQRQHYSERWSPTDGFQSDYEWQSFNEAQIRALAYQLARNGWPYEYVNRFGKHTLLATDPTGAVTIDTWEIGVSKLSLSIAKHPTVLNIIANSGDAEAVTRGIKAALEGTEAYSAITDLNPVHNDDEALLFKFLDQARQGADSFYQTMYTLRHNTNVSNRYNVNVADQNIDSIYSTAELLTETQNAAAWVFPLPGRLAYKLQTIAADFFARYGQPANHQWGWLKYGSAESTAANTRVNISTEYEFGLISLLHYVAV